MVRTINVESWLRGLPLAKSAGKSFAMKRRVVRLLKEAAGHSEKAW
jgi:hypothetical protein